VRLFSKYYFEKDNALTAKRIWAVGDSLLNVRQHAPLVGSFAFMYYYLFLQSRLIPNGFRAKVLLQPS